MSNTNSGDFMSGLQDAVRQNPVSAALIGMGVLWMFTGGAKITAAAALLSPAARATATGIGSGLEGAANAAGTLGEGLRSATSRVSDTIRETVGGAATAVASTASQTYEAASGTASDRASEIKDNLRHGTSAASGMAGTLQENLKDTFERQPLLLGAIGLALGAGMAASVPRTQLESEYAGEAAEKVTALAKEFATAQVDRATAAAERTFEAVKGETAAQGPTPQGAKDAAAAVAEKVKTVAKTAAKTATKTARGATT
jgi:hypothetical protein